jgi:hypothetical protein
MISKRQFPLTNAVTRCIYPQGNETPFAMLDKPRKEKTNCTISHMSFPPRRQRYLAFQKERTLKAP